MFSTDPQPSSAGKNYDYDYNVDPSGKSHFYGNITTVQLKKTLSFSLSGDPYQILNLHAMTSFFDKLLAKYLGGLLAVNLLAIAAIASLAWMFVICALKPGCPVYNWREVGPRSRHSRLQSELYSC